MHPLSAFSHCPRCGTASLEIREFRAVHCQSCDFLFFANAASAVGGFVFYERQVIMAVRAKDPEAGKLDLPGGFTEFGETFEEGLAREIKEELNLEIVDLRYLGSAPNEYRYAGVCYQTLDAFFTCRTPSLENIQVDDDVADYVLIKPEDIVPEHLAFQSSRAALKCLLEVGTDRY